MSPGYQDSRVMCFNAEYGCRSCLGYFLSVLDTGPDQIHRFFKGRRSLSIALSQELKMVKWHFVDVEDTLQSLVLVNGVNVV